MVWNWVVALLLCVVAGCEPAPLSAQEREAARAKAKTKIVLPSGNTVWIESRVSFKLAANGCPVVQVPARGVKIADVDADGWALNVPGDNQDEDLDRGQPAKLRVKPGDVLLCWRAGDAKQEGVWESNWPYKGHQSRSRNARCDAVAFVSYRPVKDQLFPPAIGRRGNPMSKLVGKRALTKKDIDLKRLPRVFDLDKWTDHEVDKLTFDELQRIFGSFSGEFLSGWSTDVRTPALQHPGYGNVLAGWTSKLLLFLMSDAPKKQKLPLAVAACEWGLTLAGAFMDGRQNYANGGHCQGRTALVIVAGVLLGMPKLEDPRWMGERFQESSMFFRDGRSWWHDPSWKVMWRFNHEGEPDPIDQPPSTWTKEQKRLFEGYFAVACGANLGTAMFMRVMKLEEQIGRGFCECVLDQYMGEVSDEARAQLEAAGMKIPWGEDAPKPWNGDGVQLQAWRQLREKGVL